jgi:hypothetical protein
MWVLAAALIAATIAPSVVLADGDPASDVLLGENVFYPYNPAVSPALQNALNATTAAASRARFPIKVALIASPIDLGVIPSLFGRPQQYADFLEREISFQNPQLLLVVMPAGYGVQGLSSRATAAVSSLPKPAGAQSNDLAQSAITAVQKLAAASGHPIGGTTSSSGEASSSGGSTAVLFGVVVLAAVAMAAVVLFTRRRRAQAR